MVKKESARIEPIKPLIPQTNILQDLGTETLDALQTFGGSAIGNLVHTIGGKNAADVVEKYSAGMIPYTKPSQYAANSTGRWGNRLNNTANSLSMVLGGEVGGAAVGKGVGYGVKKITPYIQKAFKNIYKLNP